MVFAIIRHAFKMIFSDLGTVLKISMPIVALIVARLVLVGVVPANDTPMDTRIGVLAPLDIVASLWVAVGWHRYVLLAERPNGALPRFHQAQMIHYFLKGLALMLIMMVPAGFFFLLAYLFHFWQGVFIALLMLSVFALLVSIWVAARCSPSLPAAAIDTPLNLLNAWEATRPIAGGIAGLIVLHAVAAMVLGTLGLMLTLAVPILGAVFLGGAQWLMTLLPLSVITTLYGVYAEGRELA